MCVDCWGTFLSGGLGLHRGRPRRWLPRRAVHYLCWSGDWRYRIEWRPRKGLLLVMGERPMKPDLKPAKVTFAKGWPVMKKRQTKAAMGDANHLAPMESERFRDLLALVEHMAVRKYDDGDPRETGWVTLKTQGAAWAVQVKDPDACCSFTCVGETLDKALETAALLLSCDEAPWEPDTFLQAAAARKKRK